MTIEYVGNDEFILRNDYGKIIIENLNYYDVEEIIESAKKSLDKYMKE